MLCFVSVTGSIVVSYVRAQALANGLDLRDGLSTRAERVLLLGGGLIISPILRIILWILAIMSYATVIQRLYVAWGGLRGDRADEEEEP